MSIKCNNNAVSDSTIDKISEVISTVQNELMLEFPNELMHSKFPNVEISNSDHSEYHGSKISISWLIVDKEVDLIKPIIRHEHIHWLINEIFMATPVAALDEGIAVALSDWKFRKNTLQFTQHHLCHQLLIDNLLLPMPLLLKGHIYYGLRHDFRVDVQFSSFCEFYIDKFGLKHWAVFCNDISNRNSGVPEVDFQHIIPYLKEWQEYIANSSFVNKECREYYRKMDIKSEVTLTNIHCPSCYYPDTGGTTNCGNCGYDLLLAKKRGLFNLELI